MHRLYVWLIRMPRFRLCGGSIWESNPSLAPRRSETAVLRTVSDTGHLVPSPARYSGFCVESIETGLDLFPVPVGTLCKFAPLLQNRQPQASA